MDGESSKQKSKPATAPRGRPIKSDTQDPSAERRRIQVRLNQRHLRQRRQSAHEALQKKIQNLQDAVDSVSDAFIKLNDALLNSGVATEIATPLRTTLDQVLKLAREAFDESEGLEKSAENTVLPTSEPLQHTRGQSQSLITSSPQPALIIPSNAGLRDNVIQNVAANVTFQSQARSLALAPPSFAVLLSFNTVLYGYRLLADNIVFDDEEAKSMFSLRSRFESFHDIIDSVRKGLYFYLQCVQMPDCSFGNVIGVPVPSWEELTATSKPFRDVSVEKNWVSQAIEANLSHTGHSGDQYMDSWAVESYLKEKWFLELDAQSSLSSATVQQGTLSLPESSGTPSIPPFQSQASVNFETHLGSAAEGDIFGALPTTVNYGSSNLTTNMNYDRSSSVQSFSHLIHDNDIHVLVQRLAKASICFGSEPRWSKGVVDSVVNGFIFDRRSHRAKMAKSLSPGSAWFTLRFAP